MDALSAEKLFGAGAAGRLIGCEGEVLQAVESTMDNARRLAVADAPDGYVVLAEMQRSGRGRKGSWECPAREGLLMSVILRLGMRKEQRKLISLMGAVAAAEAAQHFGPEALIKWPNDIVIAEKTEALKLRKFGGVLVEQAPQGDSAPAHILGIGLNVNQDRRRLPAAVDLPATSLKIERGGRPVDRNDLCSALLKQLNHWYGKLRSGQGEALLARWRTLSCLLGKTVHAEVEGRPVEGEVLGLRASGELILRATTGVEMLLTTEKTTLVFKGTTTTKT